MPTMNPVSSPTDTLFSEFPPIAASQTEPTETPKMMVRELLRKMSEEATFEEILYEIETLAGVIRGVEEADAGKGIPHEEFLEQIKKWNLK